jgi:DNA invertase Pin-like site-specific DNA recombinase
MSKLQGREAAQKRGVPFGGPRKPSTDWQQLARPLVLEGKSVSEIARTFVHPATIYRLPEAEAVGIPMSMQA